MPKKVIKKEYIPNSKAFKVTYDDGGIGFGADPGIDSLKPVVDNMRESLGPSGAAIPMHELPKKQKDPIKDYSKGAFDPAWLNDEYMDQAFKDARIDVVDGLPRLNERQEELLAKGLTMLDMGAKASDMDEETALIIEAMTDAFD